MSCNWCNSSAEAVADLDRLQYLAETDPERLAAELRAMARAQPGKFAGLLALVLCDEPEAMT